MRYFLSLAALASLAALPLAAQERAAGQANDAQVNWSALSAKLNAIDNQNKALAASLATLQTSVNGINGKLDAIAACGAQKKVWTGSGCITAAATCQAAYTAKTGKSCPAGTTQVVTGVSGGGGGFVREAGGGSSGGTYSIPSASASYSCMRIVCN
jgi:hypothetical protein